MKRLLRISLLTWLACLAGTAAAHEVRPGYLEIREFKPGSYDVLWKVPASGEFRLAMYVRLPKDCTGAPSSGAMVGGAFVERFRANCPGGLTGKEVTIDGLSATRTDVLARVERLDGTTQTTRLTPESPSFEVTAAPSRFEVAKTYFALGIEHILLGVDHLLFVLGLLFLVGNWKRLVATVTAFTVAHSITLAAATLGYANVPMPPVEAAIALSILFLGPEIVRRWRGETSFTIRNPWVVAFAFGLLHGFGFASALTSAGLPASDVPVALLCFNIGVEIGQLGFVGLVLILERGFQRIPVAWPDWVRVLPGYAVGTMGAFWTIQRLGVLVQALR